ncbi:MAG: glycoside hydrolase family 3 C-terminal domain-containing protein [Prevotella sp.]|nr:glycoside hydrolase family 3 C-terminal domain-containing protein [Prevotella sp.]
MKRLLMTTLTILSACALSAQPKLTTTNIGEVLAAMTNEEKALLLVGGGFDITIGGTTYTATPNPYQAAGVTRAIPRLGIPGTILTDGPAGARLYSDGLFATGFPVGTLLASSWDTDLMTATTAAMGNEVLEYGCDVLLAPGTNIHRNPLCGRNFEYYSEDPLVAGKMAAAFIRGIQSNGVGTSIKHFACNDQETNRDHNNAIVSKRALREIYLKNFEIAVKEASPLTVMSSYNQINGAFSQQRHDLLTTVLRSEWGYGGIVMTDWGDKAGTVKAVKAGNDLMEPGAKDEYERIIAAVNDGTISQEELDRNVRNMLEYIVKTPAFAGYKPSNKPDLEAHAQIARDAAAESIILLRNEGQTLPLNGNEKIALYGISAIDFVAGGTGSGDVVKPYVVNMRQALETAGFTLDSDLTAFYQTFYDNARAKWSLAPVDPKMKMFIGFPKLEEVEIPSATIEAQAKTNDIAMIVIGRNAGEGADRKVKNDFELSAVERDLIYDVSAAYHLEGKKVVVILNIGGVIETATWKNQADAIILPWSPGQEGANAIADILTGKVNPSGKTTMTFPASLWDNPSTKNFPYNYAAPPFSFFEREPQMNVDYTNYDEGIYVGYRYFATNNVAVSYPFGYGLSYTDFAYSNPKVKATADGLVATIDVTNTGQTAGKEVVELFVKAPAGGLDKPAIELKAFAKTGLLAPGKTETLTMPVSNYALASFNEQTSAWEAAAGTYTLLFSADAATPRATAAYKLAKPLSWQVDDVLGEEE